jgi:hypothetical protein
MTLVETTKGFIFGGYIPCEWDSSDNWKVDETLKSFLFTLKNPHNIPARKFPLKPEQKDLSICCYTSAALIWIGNSGAIGIYPECNSNSNSTTRGFDNLTSSYVNDTGIDGQKFFTGELNFTVKELEIFELID